MTGRNKRDPRIQGLNEEGMGGQGKEGGNVREKTNTKGFLKNLYGNFLLQKLPEIYKGNLNGITI